ncbi:hypothetical protein GQ457_02G027880 [Hibiscus cannabinus]
MKRCSLERRNNVAWNAVLHHPPVETNVTINTSVRITVGLELAVAGAHRSGASHHTGSQSQFHMDLAAPDHALGYTEALVHLCSTRLPRRLKRFPHKPRKGEEFKSKLVEILSGEAKVVDSRSSSSQHFTSTKATTQSIKKPPYFDGAHYSHWKNMMMIFLQSIDYKLWDIIEDGPTIPMKRVGEILVPKERHEWSGQEKKQVQLIAKARRVNFQKAEVITIYRTTNLKKN